MSLDIESEVGRYFQTISRYALRLQRTARWLRTGWGGKITACITNWWNCGVKGSVVVDSAGRLLAGVVSRLTSPTRPQPEAILAVTDSGWCHGAQHPPQQYDDGPYQQTTKSQIITDLVKQKPGSASQS